MPCKLGWMCGRYVQTANVAEIKKRFRCKSPDFEIVPNTNIAPTTIIPTILAERDERRVVRTRWGFDFYDQKTGKEKAVFNATAEKVAKSNFFRKSFLTRRCLIPATGFYEWPKVGDDRRPRLYQLKDEEIFAFAGMWRDWSKGEGDVSRTATIITTESNELVGQLHHRMPVILHQKDESAWLDPGISDEKALLSLLKPFPSKLMSVEVATLPSTRTASSRSAPKRKKSSK